METPIHVIMCLYEYASHALPNMSLLMQMVVRWQEEDPSWQAAVLRWRIDDAVLNHEPDFVPVAHAGTRVALLACRSVRTYEHVLVLLSLSICCCYGCCCSHCSFWCRERMSQCVSYSIKTYEQLCTTYKTCCDYVFVCIFWKQAFMWLYDRLNKHHIHCLTCMWSCQMVLVLRSCCS